MNNIFQIITIKITTFVTVIIVAVTSILPGATTNVRESVDSSTKPSIIVSESPSSSSSIKPTFTPTVKTKIESTPVPTLSPSTMSDSQTINNPSPTSSTQPKTYPIVPITVMSIGAMEPHLQIIAQKAYQEFLQTSNLNQLDESNQMEILVGIYARMLRTEITTTQHNVDWINQQLVATSTPIPFQPDSAIMTKLDELRQSLSNIQNQPEPMNVIEGKKQRAYQDWMQNNVDVYRIVSGNTYYLNEINSIKQAYGI